MKITQALIFAFVAAQNGLLRGNCGGDSSLNVLGGTDVLPIWKVKNPDAGKSLMKKNNKGGQGLSGAKCTNSFDKCAKCTGGFKECAVCQDVSGDGGFKYELANGRCVLPITFEDLAGEENFVPNGYKGLNWENAVYLDAAEGDFGNFRYTGYFNGLVSGSKVMYNPFGAKAVLSAIDTETFSVGSLYATGAWSEGLVVKFTGLKADGSVVEHQVTTTFFNYTKVDFDGFVALQSFSIESSGGIDQFTGGPATRTQFAIDNILIS